MKKIGKVLCEEMHRFVSLHIDKLEKTPCDLGEWKNEKAMLRSIKNNPTDAGWALCELLTIGMDKDYTNSYVFDKFVNEAGYDVEIFKIIDSSGKERYFKINCDDYTPIEVKKVPKTVYVWQ